MKTSIRHMLAHLDITTLHGKLDYLLLLFAHHTGLRFVELERLLIGHVYEYGRVCHLSTIPPTREWGNRELEPRTFVLNLTARKCVRKLLEIYRGCGWRVRPRVPLFQYRGRSLTAQVMKARLEALRISAGLESDFDLELLKRSLAQHLFNSGVALKDLDAGVQWALVQKTPDLRIASSNCLDELGLEQLEPWHPLLEVA